MQIGTTGKLRTFIADAMTELKAGKLDIGTAQLVVKMSGRITESLYAEAKIQRLLIESGREPGDLGSQSLGEPSS